MRAFIALDIPDTVKKNLSDVIRHLSAVTSNARWVSPSRMHLTLAFLGDIPGGAAVDVQRAMEQVCGSTTPFSFEVKGIGHFGAGNGIRLLWCGIHEPSGCLERLKSGLDDLLAPLGFLPESRSFHPHITLGRFKRPSGDVALRETLDERSEQVAGEAFADGLTLYKSTLAPSGAIYDVVAHTLFGGGK